MKNRILLLDELWEAKPGSEIQPLDGKYVPAQWKIESSESKDPEDYEEENFTHLLVSQNANGGVKRQLLSIDWDPNSPANRVLLLRSLPKFEVLLNFSVQQYDKLFGKGPLLDSHGTLESSSGSLCWKGATVMDDGLRALFVFADVYKLNGKWEISERTVRDGLFASS